MSEELDLLHQDIEAVIEEMDDWIEISALKDSNAWSAVARRMDAIDQPLLNALKAEAEHDKVRWMQGYLSAFDDLRTMIENSSQSAADAQSDLADKQREKDSIQEV